MAQQIQDDGFHEIQLNGKQLVFLFMAATVVSVVIFLCGVLVGRGVRSQVGATPDTATLNTAPETTSTEPASPATPPAAGSDPTIAAPPAPPAEDYFNRLENKTAPAEHLKTADNARGKPVDDARGKTAERTAAAAPHTPPPAPAAAKEPAHAAVPAPVPAATSGASEPSGPGFAVQIAALNVRSEADAIARRLSSKGYAAYVLTPASGTPSVFRVRVGKFPTKREAESVAAKLQKEEQFKPWVTR